LHLRMVTAAALALTVLAGCAGQLRTGPQNAGNACDAALISGTLARSEATGLGVRNDDGVVDPVVWPFGFSIRQDLTTVVLIDAAGRTLAREGDRIEAGGGANADGIFAICPADSIRVQVQID
jgi:hypothetical protein